MIITKSRYFGTLLGAALSLVVGATTSYGSVYAPSATMPDSDPFVLGPTGPGKWGPSAFGTGATVTWSLMPTGVSCAAEFGGCTNSHLSSYMPAAYKPQIVAAFAAWSAVANLTFVEVADSGSGFPFNSAGGTAGDIRIGGHTFDGAGSTLAHAYYPPVNGATAAGDIHFDIADAWKIGFGGPGFDIFQVSAHEIGHSIGLAHTDAPGSLMNPFYTEAISGPQANDIAGAVFLYGAPSVVPLPAALPLFGSALFLMGLMGWRQRKKATA